MTHERATVFTSTDAVDLVWSQFVRAASEKRFEVLAYCFMPDHAHLVVEGQSDESDLKAFVARTKQYAGYYHAAQRRTRLWQHGCHDHIVRDRVDLLDRIRYVVNNPVAAGLVAAPQDYPFLGSQRWTMAELISRLKAGAI